jgi:hypothetical protein
MAHGGDLETTEVEATVAISVEAGSPVVPALDNVQRDPGQL